MDDLLGIGEPVGGQARHTCWFRRMIRGDAKEWIGDAPPTEDELRALWDAVHDKRWTYPALSSALLAAGKADLSASQIGKCARMDCRRCDRTGPPELVTDD